MAKIPSLIRREEPTSARDADRDGRVDTPPADSSPATSSTATYGSATTVDGERPATTAGPRTATAGDSRTDEDTVATGRRTDLEKTIDMADGDRTPGTGRASVPEPAPVVDPGPKPRASLLATLSLVLGVVGALFVLSGTLAGYGIAVGAVGALLAVAGLAATRRRHVAGRTDALLGLVLGLAAVVAGIVAMTGLYDWPTTDGDWVQRFRDWLDAQFVDRF
jgi:hypothetical protein